MSWRELLAPAIIILAFIAIFSVATAMAATASLAINVSNTVYRSLFGAHSKVVNTLFAVDRGFEKATQSQPPSGTDPRTPVGFASNTGLATNGVTLGDWIVTFAVNTTANTPVNSNFTVVMNFNEGVSATISLYLKTGSTVSSSSLYEILCKFDIGPTLASPYSYTFGIIQTK